MPLPGCGNGRADSTAANCAAALTSAHITSAVQLSCHTQSLPSHVCIMQVEGISMKEDALARLGQLAEQTTLRHAVQLLTPASVLSKNNGREEISAADVEEVHGLFHDAKYTAQLLAEQADKYMH